MTPHSILITAKDISAYGAARMVVHYAKALRESDFEVTVVHGKLPDELGATQIGTAIDELHEAGVRTRRLPALSSRFLSHARAKLKAILQESPPQLVIGSQMRDIAVAMPAARQLRISTLAFVQNLPRFTGNPVVRSLKRRIYQTTMQRDAMKIVAVAPAIAKELVRDFDVPDFKVAYILNGLDVPPEEDRHVECETSVRAEFKIPSERPLLINVARFHVQKGQDLLIEALHVLQQRPVPIRPAVLLAGDYDGPGGKAFYHHVRDLVTRYDLNDTVHFLGFRNDCHRLISASDAFVLPSRWEGLPLGILEAFSCRTPVVMAEYGERFPDFVDTKDGIYCEKESPHGLADAMTSVLSLSKVERRSMGNRGRAYLQSHLSLAAGKRAFVEIVRAVLTEGSSLQPPTVNAVSRQSANTVPTY